MSGTEPQAADPQAAPPAAEPAATPPAATPPAEPAGGAKGEPNTEQQIARIAAKLLEPITAQIAELKGAAAPAAPADPANNRQN